MKRNRRELSIRFLVRSDEKAQFEEAAARADQSLSDWIRGAAKMRATGEAMKATTEKFRDAVRSRSGNF